MSAEGNKMKIDISDAEKNIDKIMDALSNGEVDTILVCKDGIPVVQMKSISNETNLRVGAAKKEMNGFDLSLEDFNNIETPLF